VGQTVGGNSISGFRTPTGHELVGGQTAGPNDGLSAERMAPPTKSIPTIPLSRFVPVSDPTVETVIRSATVADLGVGPNGRADRHDQTPHVLGAARYPPAAGCDSGRTTAVAISDRTIHPAT
jgi:hypothetical protein